MAVYLNRCCVSSMVLHRNILLLQQLGPFPVLFSGVRARRALTTNATLQHTILSPSAYLLIMSPGDPGSTCFVGMAFKVSTGAERVDVASGQSHGGLHGPTGSEPQIAR